MKILLVNPPLSYYMGIQYVYQPTIGLPILAAILERAGHEVELLDAEALAWRPHQVAEYAQCYDFEAVGLTALTLSARGAAECIAEIRKRTPGVYIVVGGVHATLEPQEALAWGVDAVAIGEADNLIVELFKGRLPGIWRGPAVTDLDALPEPAWHLLALKPINQYPGNMLKLGHPEGIVMSARGCPSRCSFCGNAIFGRRPWRARTPRLVADEIQHLRERWGINSIFDYSDEFVGMSAMQVRWLHEFAGEMIKRPGLTNGLTLKVQGRCSSRFVDYDTLARLREAGVAAVMWGVESFSDKVLKAVHKGTTVDMIWHTLRSAKQAGLFNFLFMMTGNLQERPEDAELSVEGLRQARAEGLINMTQVTVASPQLGTEMYEIAKRDGWLVEQPALGAAMHEVYAATPWMSVDELRHYRDLMLAVATGRAE